MFEENSPDAATGGSSCAEPCHLSQGAQGSEFTVRRIHLERCSVVGACHFCWRLTGSGPRDELSSLPDLDHDSSDFFTAPSSVIIDPFSMNHLKTRSS